MAGWCAKGAAAVGIQDVVEPIASATARSTSFADGQLPVAREFWWGWFDGTPNSRTPSVGYGTASLLQG